MTQAGREHVTQCISLVHADQLRIASQRLGFYMLPHKARRKIEVIICKITRLKPTLCVAWCLICWFALAYKRYGHTWHRMSLLRPGVIKQHKPNQTKPTCSNVVYIILIHTQVGLEVGINDSYKTVVWGKRRKIRFGNFECKCVFCHTCICSHKQM